MSESDNIPLYDPAPGPSTTPVQWQWPNVSAPSGAEIGAAGSATAAFASLVQGIQAAKRARHLADYNAQVAEANAQAQAQAAQVEALQYTRQAAMTREDALVLRQAESYREARQADANAMLLGQTRAIIAASGLQMTGSPLAVYEENVRQMSLDTLAQRYQARLQGRAIEERATEQDYAATLARHGASERLRVGSAQGSLVRANVDDTQVAAGLLQATGHLVEGAARYDYMTERKKSTTPLTSTKTPSLLGSPIT